MRTQEQISRVAAFLGLNRRQKSILEWKARKIADQAQLIAVAGELKTMSEQGCLELLNERYPFDTSRSLHF